MAAWTPLSSRRSYSRIGLEAAGQNRARRKAGRFLEVIALANRRAQLDQRPMEDPRHVHLRNTNPLGDPLLGQV